MKQSFRKLHQEGVFAAMPEQRSRYQLKDKKNPRDAALLILLRVSEEGRKSHYAVREVLALCDDMEARDRAFAKRAAEGSLDYLIRLDCLLSRYLKKPLALQKPLLRGILRLSLYQLLYMDKVPDSAVCNEAVKLAKLHGLSGLSGVVNGTLRTIVRNKEAHADRLFVIADRAAELSVPKWLYRKLCGDFGAEQAEKIASAWLSERAVTLRLNRSRASEEEAEVLLAADGVCFEKLDAGTFFSENGVPVEVLPAGGLPVFYELQSSEGLSELSAFQKGILQPQDLSSALSALFADPKAGDYIIDVCAAPGGKSLQLADMLLCAQQKEAQDRAGLPIKEKTAEGENLPPKEELADAGNLPPKEGLVDARDLSPQKVRLIEENIARSGFRNIRAHVQDALLTDEESLYRADIVIADLPCSGLGIAARKPDIKRNLRPYSIEELQGLQRDMLRIVSRYVKPHGKLVYSTCTLTPEEDEENAEFIARELGFQLKKQVKVFPGKKSDGFYAALFQKGF